jgi:hypothetical protein
VKKVWEYTEQHLANKIEDRDCDTYLDVHEKAGNISTQIVESFHGEIKQFHWKFIEEGRGLCEYQSSQKVTKKSAGSNQLRGVGKGGGG